MATIEECSNFWMGKSFSGIWEGLSNDPKSKQAQLEFKEKCGMYDRKTLDCIQSKIWLDTLTTAYGNQGLMYFDSDKTLKKATVDEAKKRFDEKDCTKVIEAYRQAELGKVIGKFSQLDQTRIEAESIYERNQRIFFGGLILIAGIILITMVGKNK
jgi:hypothetical protein